MNPSRETDPVLEEFRAARAEFERLEREQDGHAEPSAEFMEAQEALRVARRKLWKQDADRRREAAAEFAKNKPKAFRGRVRPPSRIRDLTDERFVRALHDEVVESREIVVQLITQKNRLAHYVAHSDNPDPVAVRELEELTASVEVWRELLKLREAEIRTLFAMLLRVRSEKLVPAGMPPEGRELLDQLEREIRRGNEAEISQWCRMIVQRLDQG